MVFVNVPTTQLQSNFLLCIEHGVLGFFQRNLKNSEWPNGFTNKKTLRKKRPQTICLMKQGTGLLSLTPGNAGALESGWSLSAFTVPLSTINKFLHCSKVCSLLSGPCLPLPKTVRQDLTHSFPKILAFKDSSRSALSCQAFSTMASIFKTSGKSFFCFILSMSSLERSLPYPSITLQAGEAKFAVNKASRVKGSNLVCKNWVCATPWTTPVPRSLWLHSFWQRQLKSEPVGFQDLQSKASHIAQCFLHMLPLIHLCKCCS